MSEDLACQAVAPNLSRRSSVGAKAEERRMGHAAAVQGEPPESVNMASWIKAEVKASVIAYFAPIIAIYHVMLTTAGLR